MYNYCHDFIVMLKLSHTWPVGVSRAGQYGFWVESTGLQYLERSGNFLGMKPLPSIHLYCGSCFMQSYSVTSAARLDVLGESSLSPHQMAAAMQETSVTSPMSALV